MKTHEVHLEFMKAALTGLIAYPGQLKENGFSVVDSKGHARFACNYANACLSEYENKWNIKLEK